MTTEKVLIESAPRWTWMILVTVCLTLIVIGVVRGYNDWRVARKETQAKQQAVADSIAVARATVAPTVEALVLVNECWTPCNTFVGYKYKIRGEGHALRITFTGVKEPVDYPGEGDFKTPEKFQPGDTEFVSRNKARPHVRVQIYKKITVQGGQ